MRLPRVPFTIRSLMIAVLVFACPLALPTGWLLILIGLAAPCLALFGLPWLVLGANRRRTMFDFCVSATFVNVLFAAYCIAPDLNLRIPLMLGCLVILGPAISLLGAASPLCRHKRAQSGDAFTVGLFAGYRPEHHAPCDSLDLLAVAPGLLLFEANPGTPCRPGRRRSSPTRFPDMPVCSVWLARPWTSRRATSACWSIRTRMGPSGSSDWVPVQARHDEGTRSARASWTYGLEEDGGTSARGVRLMRDRGSSHFE